MAATSVSSTPRARPAPLKPLKAAAAAPAAKPAAPAQAAKPAAPAKAAKPGKPGKPAKPRKAAPVAGPAETARQPAAQPPAAPKSAAAAAPAPASGTGAHKHGKAKAKLVRDGFTMPQADFDLIDALKARALKFQRPTKKSELLRAGLHALTSLDDGALRRVLDALVPLKTGRPRKGT